MFAWCALMEAATQLPAPEICAPATMDWVYNRMSDSWAEIQQNYDHYHDLWQKHVGDPQPATLQGQSDSEMWRLSKFVFLSHQAVSVHTNESSAVPSWKKIEVDFPGTKGFSGLF